MGQSKEERVHDVFETIYEKYDSMNSIISFNLHKSWRKETMRQMNVPKGASALDLCCGTADWTLSLAEAAGSQGHVKGLDFSANMLKIGRQKVNQSGWKTIELVEGNAMELPFDSESFDFVTIGFGLRNVPDYQQTMQEMHRVLKPGGMAVCLETSQPERKAVEGVYSLYFKYIMPRLGKYLAGRFDEYSWLQESTMNFPNKSALAVMFKQAGFKTVTVHSFSMGAAAAHFARKQLD